MIFISGSSEDNTGIDHIKVCLDEGEFEMVTGTEQWHINMDISNLELGEHIIIAKAIDIFENEYSATSTFQLNESGHEWSPQINVLYHGPENLTNKSNVVIYSNITSTSPFDMKTVLLYCDDGNQTASYEMLRYAESPVQERHEEDPLISLPNNPLFGVELGQFATATIVTYWIVAYDAVNNNVKSNECTFVIT
jgi:hypothetical protein